MNAPSSGSAVFHLKAGTQSCHLWKTLSQKIFMHTSLVGTSSLTEAEAPRPKTPVSVDAAAELLGFLPMVVLSTRWEEEQVSYMGKLQRSSASVFARGRDTAGYHLDRLHVRHLRLRQRKTKETSVPCGPLEGIVGCSRCHRPASLGAQSSEKPCHGSRNCRWAHFYIGSPRQRGSRQIGCNGSLAELPGIRVCNSTDRFPCLACANQIS